MQTFWDNVLRVVAVIGLIAVLLLGAWGIIQVAFLLPSFFGNLGGNIRGIFSRAPSAVESLTVSVPQSTVAQQPFTLNWKHTGKSGEYSYSISYSCAEGLQIAAPTPLGSYQQQACNTPFNYINASSSTPLVAVLAEKTKSAQTTFTVSASKLSGGAAILKASAATTVGAPASAATTKPATSATPKKAATKTSGATYYPSGRTSQLFGYPDLAVRIMSATSQNGNVTVIFAIENIGTNVTGSSWTFNALLPIQGSYTYPGGPQQALYPGDRIVYTMRYSADYTAAPGIPCSGWNYPCTQPPVTYGGPGTCNAYGPCAVPGYAAIPYNYNYNSQYTYGYSGGWNFGDGYQTVSVQVDPYNQVVESTKANNSASQAYWAQ